MEKERNYDNEGTDSSKEYFRKERKDNDDDTYFPQKNQNHHIIKNSRNFINRFFKIKKIKKLKYD